MGEHRLFGLGGKTAAIIGGGSGIGEAVAIGAARQGAKVVCLDMNEAAAKRVAGSIGDGAEAAALDIRDRPAVNAALDKIAKDHGRLDIMICTPSINVRKSIANYTDEDFDKVVTLNLKGTFNVLQAAGRIMTAQGGGSMVFFSSIRSLFVEPGQSVYAMTKAGIVQLMKTGAAEFAFANVRVNAIAPGVVETPLTTQIKAVPEWYNAYADKTMLKRWAKAEELVGPTLFLASDAASYVTGTILYVDAGWTAADGRFTPPGM
jgi:NAD(P)-dependent dehydrogenase (short-subunit alcohol dehydrogenase family)